MENIEQIIHKSKVLADRVRAALLLQNNLALDGFDITDVEFSKPLAQLEDKKVTSEKTLHGIQVKLSEAKRNVDEISRAYHASVEEHASLGNMKNDLLKHSEVKKLEMSRVQLETQNKLKTFKAITGTHFNFNPFEENLTGCILLLLLNVL
ncbi:hypothetical protein RUM44_008288 [Polyplax serrata]|uniref:Uncharacterized protein n=1 Tax=Polyplax serrata TaxID=468196 RepID=A0ABR1B7Z2_POLSC